MPTINYKLINICAGGEHAQLDLTPGPTVSVSLNEFKSKMDDLAALTNKEKSVWLLALHADANAKTLSQLRADLVSAPGLTITI